MSIDNAYMELVFENTKFIEWAEDYIAPMVTGSQQALIRQYLERRFNLEIAYYDRCTLALCSIYSAGKRPALITVSSYGQILEQCYADIQIKRKGCVMKLFHAGEYDGLEGSSSHPSIWIEDQDRLLWV